MSTVRVSYARVFSLCRCQNPLLACNTGCFRHFTANTFPPRSAGGSDLDDTPRQNTECVNSFIYVSSAIKTKASVHSRGPHSSVCVHTLAC